MNQKILALFGLIIFLILENLVIWQKKLFEIKDKKKNNDYVEEIKIRQSKLKDNIEDMSKDERKNKGIDKILEIVKGILNFNK